MARRYFSSTAAATALSGAINATSTSITVGTVNGFPAQTPYTLAIDRGTAAEELVEVTSAIGVSLTITRGVDGTTAKDHSTGALVEHVVSARDLDEPNSHIFSDAIGGAHAANRIAVTPAGSVTKTNVQEALQEAAGIGGVVTGVAVPAASVTHTQVTEGVIGNVSFNIVAGHNYLVQATGYLHIDQDNAGHSRHVTVSLVRSASTPGVVVGARGPYPIDLHYGVGQFYVDTEARNYLGSGHLLLIAESNGVAEFELWWECFSSVSSVSTRAGAWRITVIDLGNPA